MNDRIERHILDVTIGGVRVAIRPSFFELTTDQGFPSVIAKLAYPASFSGAVKNKAIIVSLTSDGETSELFAGEIYEAKERGAFRELLLADGYKRLLDTVITPAYRKETAAVILQDTLDAAGIASSAITCPSVELARFSASSIPASSCLTLLIKALEEHGHAGIRYFFDAENVFRFGSLADTGVNQGKQCALETGKNILRKGPGWVELFPLPIRHSQKITVDGTVMIPVRTTLRLSHSRSRLVLWLKEAA